MRIHDPIYISVPWQQHAVAQYLTQNYEDFVDHIQKTCSLMQQNWAVLSKAFKEGTRLFYDRIPQQRSLTLQLQCLDGIPLSRMAACMGCLFTIKRPIVLL
jgi:hypothetical protein